jgi:hypothetical protein
MNYTVPQQPASSLELATKLISDISQDNVDQFLEILNPKAEDSTEIERYNGLPLLHTGDDSNGYYFLCDEQKEHMLYFVKYRRINANGLKMGRQVLVWRSSTAARKTESLGITQYVFFEKILPRFGILVSDVEQTHYGRTFWEFALDRTFNTQALHAYFLNRRSTPNTLLELNSRTDLFKVAREIWGTDEGHRRTHAVISNKPIKLVPK